MSAKIIDGKAVSDKIKAEIKAEVESIKIKTGRVPGLAVVLAGEDPASKVYVTMKGKACVELGIKSIEHKLPKTVSEKDLLILVDELNKNNEINGILVQLPLPRHINEDKILNAIDPSKDVDGFHPVNVGKLMTGQDTFLPCTPYGIQKLLAVSGNDPKGKHVVVVGRSNIVGKPIAMIIVQKKEFADATVTICHSRTANLKEITSQADILIAAIGQPEYIKADMVNDKAVVIDVGVNRVEDSSKKSGYRLVGDVAFDEVKEKVQAITPVPGGVGPMTIVMLIYNTLMSFKKANNLN